MAFADPLECDERGRAVAASLVGAVGDANVSRAQICFVWRWKVGASYR